MLVNPGFLFARFGTVRRKSVRNLFFYLWQFIYFRTKKSKRKIMRDSPSCMQRILFDLWSCSTLLKRRLSDIKSRVARHTILIAHAYFLCRRRCFFWFRRRSVFLIAIKRRKNNLAINFYRCWELFRSDSALFLCIEQWNLRQRQKFISLSAENGLQFYCFALTGALNHRWSCLTAVVGFKLRHRKTFHKNKSITVDYKKTDKACLWNISHK